MSATRKRASPKPDVDALFAALADPARRRAVEILGKGPRRAGELASLLGLLISLLGGSREPKLSETEPVWLPADALGNALSVVALL